MDSKASILFFGTCAGTEPIPGMQHSAFAIRVGEFYYWFDAGENCSRTAREMGVDLLKIKSIFISHAHIDHMGGLANLIWSIRKLNIMGHGTPPDNKIYLHMPNMKSWEGLKTFLYYSETNHFSWDVEIDERYIFDGPIYEDENIKVSAVHNEHIPGMLDGAYLSFSYIIEAAGKRIVYSGDVKCLDELRKCLHEGCDILICETGHHKVDDVCQLAKEYKVGTLLFTHNGREIINHRQDVDKRLEKNDCNANICYDKMIYEL